MEAASVSRASRSRISAESSLIMSSSDQSFRFASAISAATSAVSAWLQIEQNWESGPPNVWQCGHSRGCAHRPSHGSSSLSWQTAFRSRVNVLVTAESYPRYTSSMYGKKRGGVPGGQSKDDPPRAPKGTS